MIVNPTTSNFKAEALTDEHLRSEAPSKFAQTPMSGLSRRYAFVATTDIVSGLREKNWVPVSVEQQQCELPNECIRFRRTEQIHTLDEWNEELVLTNSHDAGCSYVMCVGIYRRLCKNGLVVSDATFEAIRFRHAGLKADQVVGASYRIVEHLPRVAALIDSFRNRRLSEPETLAFAERALALRFGSVETSPIEPRTLLTPRRPEDQSNDLWTVLTVPRRISYVAG